MGAAVRRLHEDAAHRCIDRGRSGGIDRQRVNTEVSRTQCRVRPGLSVVRAAEDAVVSAGVERCRRRCARGNDVDAARLQPVARRRPVSAPVGRSEDQTEIRADIDRPGRRGIDRQRPYVVCWHVEVGPGAAVRTRQHLVEGHHEIESVMGGASSTGSRKSSTATGVV